MQVRNLHEVTVGRVEAEGIDGRAELLKALKEAAAEDDLGRKQLPATELSQAALPFWLCLRLRRPLRLTLRRRSSMRRRPSTRGGGQLTHSKISRTMR